MMRGHTAIQHTYLIPGASHCRTRSLTPQAQSTPNARSSSPERCRNPTEPTSPVPVPANPRSSSTALLISTRASVRLRLPLRRTCRSPCSRPSPPAARARAPGFPLEGLRTQHPTDVSKRTRDTSITHTHLTCPPSTADEAQPRLRLRLRLHTPKLGTTTSCPTSTHSVG